MVEQKRRIVVIDDDPSILRTLSKVLRKAGFTVDTAISGKEASEKLAAKTYDAALIDVGLGEIRGTDLLPQMQDLAPKMLKIVFTGTPFSENVVNQAKNAADVFLLKPVKPEVIIQILEERIPKKEVWN
jgi:DNA-binding NtrC family response regulator